MGFWTNRVVLCEKEAENGVGVYPRGMEAKSREGEDGTRDEDTMKNATGRKRGRYS